MAIMLSNFQKAERVNPLLLNQCFVEEAYNNLSDDYGR